MRPISGRSSASPDRLTVMYDGWSLAYQPTSPAALHLQALFAALSPEVDAVALLPAHPVFPLPETVRPVIYPHAGTPAARLRWDQVTLPLLARRLLVDVLHVTSSTAPLLHRKPVVFSPAGPFDSHQSGGRLRAALGRGGWATADALLWPADLEYREGLPKARLHHLPPLSHPIFQPAETSFFSTASARQSVLLPSPDHPASLTQSLDAWGWVSPSLGEGFELLLVGLDSAKEQQVRLQLQDFPWRDTVRNCRPESLPELAGLYRQAAVVLHLGEASPWGDASLHALASGRPLVAFENDSLPERAGPAAYLAPPGDVRRLAAALITVLIEEEVSERLAAESFQRSQLWNSAAFGEELLQVYRQVASA